MISKKGFRRWFLAAAVYNSAWGAWTVLFPDAYFLLIGMEPLNRPLWQCIGMMVLVYAPGYYLVYRQPERYAAFAAIGLLGKILGPVGFLYGVGSGALEWRFGWFLLANDLMWWPAFAWFCWRYCRSPFDSCGAMLEQGHDRLD